MALSRQDRLCAALLAEIRSPITENAGQCVRMERVDFAPADQFEAVLVYADVKRRPGARRVRLVAKTELVGTFGRELKYVFAIDYDNGGTEQRFSKRMIVSLRAMPAPDE